MMSEIKKRKIEIGMTEVILIYTIYKIYIIYLLHNYKSI